MKTIIELLRTRFPKGPCPSGDCPSTTYYSPKYESYLCVICDHEEFEACVDCSELRGWCGCPSAGSAGTAHPLKRTEYKKNFTVKTRERTTLELVYAAIGTEEMKNKDVHEAVPRSSDAINSALRRLVEEKKIVRPRRGVYRRKV